ncbi:uncharacterized protein Dwil_GK12597 [Drosophila willistoni]|uniref:Uncharacterized protein n=2 Tax=Drosophila willistoni TaxID=7260 RepID=B4N308_DROWI|nr:uncharacterized protein Dwil_GK12597 [Drosophila willistoni]
MSGNRTILKHGSVTARHRQTRINRLTRHSCFTLKRPTIFHLRKSLVDYVDEDLRDMETSVFYQRIFILAKNIHPGQRQVNPQAAVPYPSAMGSQGLADEARFSVNTQLTVAGSIQAESMEGQVQDGTAELPTDLAEDTLQADGDESSNASSPEGSQIKTLNLNEDEFEAEGRGNSETSAGAQNAAGDLENIETVTHTYRFDEEENTMPEDEDEEEPDLEQMEETNMPKDFYALFQERLHELHKKCFAQTFTPDPMCGLFLYMGDYSMLMLETGEDMMGMFCRELVNCLPEFWSSNRVFLIEDHIKELYTKELISRRIPAAYINEKFPTSTPTDEYLMGKQHMIIKEKLTTICTLINESTRQDHHFETSSQISTDEDEDLTHRSIITAGNSKSIVGTVTDVLPVDTYRRLLPEIQRIDLVLASTRFYYTLTEFTNIYGHSPSAPDDDSLFWPIQNQYTPPNIFMRTPFDINLTFSDYAAEMVRRQEEEKFQEQQMQVTIGSVDDIKPATQQQPQQGDRHSAQPSASAAVGDENQSQAQAQSDAPS